jgi:hypothetical protein
MSLWTGIPGQGTEPNVMPCVTPVSPVVKPLILHPSGIDETLRFALILLGSSPNVIVQQ